MVLHEAKIFRQDYAKNPYNFFTPNSWEAGKSAEEPVETLCYQTIKVYIQFPKDKPEQLRYSTTQS